MEQRRQHRVCRLHTWVRSFIDHFHGKAESTGVAEQRANVVHVSVAQKDACRGILSSSKRGVAPTSKTIHHGPAGSHPPTHEDESHADAGLRPRGDRVPLSQLHSFVSAGFLGVQWMNESYSNFFTHDSTFSHNWVAPTVANAETQLKAIKRSVHRSQGSHQSPFAWDKHQPGASVITATILRSRAKAHRYLVIQYGKPKSNRRSRAPSLLLLMRLILGLPIPTKSTRRNGG